MSDSFYKIVTDEVMTAILVITPTGACHYANQMAHDLLELPLDFNLNEFKIERLYVADSEPKHFCEKTLTLQGHLPEITINKWNGSQFIASLGIKQIQIENQKFKLLIIQDVTLQKKMQRDLTQKQTAIYQAFQDLQKQNKQLQELDVAKNRFIAMVTHDLRTPLSAIIASSEILKLKLYDTPEQLDEFTLMIHDQGNQMLNLVNDILDFVKIQSGKMDYFIESTDIREIINQEVAALCSLADQSNIKISALPFAGNGLCYFDKVRIKQVVNNLLSNAIKYNRTNGTVQVKLEETEIHLSVTIEDTGIGIESHNLEKVFNEFETLGNIAHHAKGTGLGLPITKRMIEAMGGNISISSKFGEGSLFKFMIPKTKVLPEELYRSRPETSETGDLAA